MELILRSPDRPDRPTPGFSKAFDKVSHTIFRSHRGFLKDQSSDRTCFSSVSMTYQRRSTKSDSLQMILQFTWLSIMKMTVEHCSRTSRNLSFGKRIGKWILIAPIWILKTQENAKSCTFLVLETPLENLILSIAKSFMHIHVINFKEASGRFFFHFLEVFKNV